MSKINIIKLAVVIIPMAVYWFTIDGLFESNPTMAFGITLALSFYFIALLIYDHFASERRRASKPAEENERWKEYWVARDSDNSIFISEEKPYKNRVGLNVVSGGWYDWLPDHMFTSVEVTEKPKKITIVIEM
jgi:hypothetical protein